MVEGWTHGRDELDGLGDSVRGLHQASAATNTLHRPPDGVPVDLAALRGTRTEPDTVVGESVIAEEGVTREGITQEKTRGLSDELTSARHALSAERERYRELFESTPAAYLLTDMAGVVREANRRAVALLGVEHCFLVGKPLAAFVTAGERRALRQWLNRPIAPGELRESTLRLRPRNRPPVVVSATVGVARDNTGRVTEVRWLLREAPGDVERPSADPGVLVELLTGQPSSLGESPDAIRDVVDTLREVVQTAAGQVGADGGALALVDKNGALQWATATNQPPYLPTQCVTNLLADTKLNASVAGWLLAIPDVGAEQRWLRLGPAAALYGVRSVLAAPVRIDGRTAGALMVVTDSSRPWSDGETQAIRGYAAILGRVLVTAADAVEQRRLAGQLQAALDARVVIEQAKGVLMERNQLPPSQAAQLLRGMARSSGRRMADVAADVIADPHA